MPELSQILKDAGLSVIDKAVPGRPGQFGPLRGVVVHHTAGAISGGSTASLEIVINGRPDLHGPLCNLYLARSGDVYLISEGRANHAGLGSGSVLARVIAGLPPVGPGPDNTDGNQYFYGIEVENDGTGEPYPQHQLDVLVEVCAAICKAEGWNENHVIHHREWTKRKVDMSWHGDLRSDVAKHLNQPAPPPPKPPKPVPPVPPQHFPGDHMTRHQYHINFDGKGNGWATLSGVSYNKVIAGYCQGSYPPSDGYWPIPKLAFQQRDGDTVAEVTDGGANQSTDIVVWVAD